MGLWVRKIDRKREQERCGRGQLLGLRIERRENRKKDVERWTGGQVYMRIYKFLWGVY